HIHGELLKLGFTLAQSTVARYMYRGWPPSQDWRTFLTNHVDGIAAIDLFVLPTITFRLLYCLVILRHGRRLWVSFGVTTNPTVEWISRCIAADQLVRTTAVRHITERLESRPVPIVNRSIKPSLRFEPSIGMRIILARRVGGFIDVGRPPIITVEKGREILSGALQRRGVGHAECWLCRARCIHVRTSRH